MPWDVDRLRSLLLTPAGPLARFEVVESVGSDRSPADYALSVRGSF